MPMINQPKLTNIPAISFQESLGTIQKRLEKIVYGQLNILAPKTQFTFNQSTGDYQISNFYRYSNYANQGSCGELRDSIFTKC
jgi:hypothetical protein